LTRLEIVEKTDQAYVTGASVLKKKRFITLTPVHLFK
jgi:hypothetical protein